MNSRSINSSEIKENGQMSDPLCDTDVHSCSTCGTKFSTLPDLESHCQLYDKKNLYKCSLCDEVFTDLEQLKVHDLRHSLEEAEEDITDIEQMILPFGLKSCDICGEKFSCDEELINHSVRHPEAGLSKEKFFSDEELKDQPDTDNEEEMVNYPILRQEIVKDVSGRTDIHFILIDHQNEQVEEYTHTLHNPVINKKKMLKSNTKIVKSKNVKNKKITRTRTNARIKVIKISSSSDDDDITFIKSTKSLKTKQTKENNATIKDMKSEENDCEDVEYDSKSRRSKQIAMKRKIWNEKVYLPPPQKLKDCPTCNKSFGDLEDFKKHILTHKPKSETSEGQSASFSLTDKKTPIKNEEDADEEDEIKDWIEISCGICYNTFCRKKGLRKHLINIHKLDAKKIAYYLDQVPHNAASYHTCTTCKKQFYRESRLHSHDCVPAISVICELCKQKISSKGGLKRHLLTSHKLGESKTNSLLDQLSNYNAKFYRKTEPVGAVAVSSSDGRFIGKKGSKLNALQGKRCETCYKAFTDESGLEEHKCCSKIKIKCEICKYNFPSKYNLKRHLVRIHKLTLNDAENVMNEFQYYNERLVLKHPIVVKKKKSSVQSNVKSSTSSRVSSKELELKKDLKKHAKEILLNKSKKLLLTKSSKSKNVITKTVSRKIISELSSSKMSISSLKKLNTSARPSSSKKSSKSASLSKTPTGPPSSRKLNSSRSSSKKLSDIAKKKKKMKYTSADIIKKVVAKKLVTKSRKYFGKNASSKYIRKNKK